MSTTQLAQANDDRSASQDSDKQLVITEPAGAQASVDSSMGSAQIRASNLIGEKVIDSSGKNCGTVKDALIDLNSGRLAFLVIDSRGRQIAVPGNACRTEGQQVTLNIERDRLQNAPTFSYQNLNDQNWINQTYSFYGEPWQGGQGGQVAMSTPSYQSSQNFQSGGTTYQSGSSYGTTYSNPGFTEAAGGNAPGLVTGRDQDCYADCILHKYQLGKQHAAWVDEHYWNNVPADRLYTQYPGSGASYNSYASSSSYSSQPSYSSEWSSSSTSQPQSGQIWYGSGGQIYSGQQGSMISESAGASSGMHLYRSSELVGMHIRANNGQDLGEIRDVVLDLNSGRVAYTVVVPTGGQFGGRYLAIPPTAFTRSGSDQHVLSLNMSTDQLRNAPSFEPNNWPQPQNQTFIGEVNNFYHVSGSGQGNWRHDEHMRHHEGTGSSTDTYHGSQDLNNDQGSSNSGNDQGSIQNQNQNQQNQQPVSEPSGSDVKGAEHQTDAIREPSGATSDKSSDQSSASGQSSSQTDQSQSSSSGSTQSSQSSATQAGTSGGQSSTELKSSQSQPGTATSEAAGANSSTSSSDQSNPSSTSSSSSTSPDQSGTQSSSQSSATSTNPDQTSTSSSSTTGNQPSTSTDQSSNQGLSERVRTTLRSDSTLSPISSQVQVSDQNGKISLTGNVKSEAEKQQIVSKAEEVAGSGNVIDNLQVKSDNNSSNP